MGNSIIRNWKINQFKKTIICYSSYIISNSELHGFTNKQKLRLSTLVHAHRSFLHHIK